MPKMKLFSGNWIFIVLIAILFAMVLGLNTRLSEFFRLNRQLGEMQDRIANLEATSITLETDIAYANTEKAVEEWARTYERMGKEGDQLIIPIPPADVTPDVNYLPTPDPQTAENWQIWWEFLFGEN